MTMVASSGEPADYLEQAEVVEDDLLMAMGGKEIATGLSPSKCSLAQLRFWSALFSPQTPPPKSAASNRF